MSTFPSTPRFPRWRRFWKLITATTAGGTAFVIWFEEIVAVATEFIGVIFIFIMTGVIYLFNVYVFKSALGKADDLKK